MTPASRGRWAFALTVAAVAWVVALVIAAFVAPAYNDGSTLVAVNGLWVALPVAVPAALAAVAWAGLHRKCSQTGRAGDRAAWAAIALLGAFALLAAASIGLFIAPAAAMLVVAATLTPAARPTNA
jgi:hypothetical protein